MVSDLKKRISELAALMEEFRLAEAELESGGEHIAFKRRSAPAITHTQLHESAPEPEHIFPVEPDPVADVPKGIPVSSPMMGIYYGAPSPNAPPFVKEGESVTAGQVVGLIEAMKVFNEITASTTGIVTKLLAESGQLVQPGDPLLYIG